MHKKSCRGQDERKSIPNGSNLSQPVRHGSLCGEWQFENERLLVRRRAAELRFDMVVNVNKGEKNERLRTGAKGCDRMEPTFGPAVQTDR